MSAKTKSEMKAFVAPYVEATNQIGALLLPPVWAVKEIMGVVYSSQKQTSFQDFVDGIAYYFATNSIGDKEAKALIENVSDSDNYETMTGILDAVFFSHSKIARAVLGIITGKFMRNDTLDYDDMVLVAALKDIFDEDLNRFWMYFAIKPKDEDDHTSFVENYSATDRLIVEKLQNSGILGRDLASNRLGGASLRFELTSVSKRLHMYLSAIRPFFIS